MKKLGLILKAGLIAVLLTACQKEKPEAPESETVFTTSATTTVSTATETWTETTTEDYGIVTEAVTTVYVNMDEFTQTMPSESETLVLDTEADTGFSLLDASVEKIMNNIEKWGKDNPVKVGLADLNLDGVPEYIVTDIGSPIAYEESDMYPTIVYDLKSGEELCSFEDSSATGIMLLNNPTRQWVVSGMNHFYVFDMFCGLYEPLKIEDNKFYVEGQEVDIEEYNEQFSTRFDFNSVDTSNEVIFCNNYISKSNLEEATQSIRRAMDKWIVNNDLFELDPTF